MEKDKKKTTDNNKMKLLFGFDFNDFKTWNNFVKLMNRPEDPSNLAVFRILFGLIMMIDIPHERGMTEADIEYGPEHDCYFPLFDFLQPLEPEWMLVIYSIMFMGAFGIMIGYKFRFSCLCFDIPYWYIFFIDKTTWNNHSYLYGLIGFLLFFTDANRFWSVDAMLDKNIQNTHIPLWNYCLFKTQIFLVYFLAGIKKLDFDWINGYSMENLGSHWVFEPFKLFLTEKQITLYIVHICGLILDLSVGYLLFFDATRLVGTAMSSSFHIMNSRMFNIGMFPYTMLASTPIFYSNDWPKRFINYFTKSKYNNLFKIKKLSSHCIYDKNELKSENNKKDNNSKEENTKVSYYHKIFSLLTIIYITEQSILPFSHSITKGYNNWTNGLYGYSWDMMVHSWHTQHIKISFIDKKTNKTHYLNPKAWTNRKRWSSHADMIYQYTHCIKEKLYKYNYTDIEIYMDIWRSMNHRFNQRQIDPRVNLLKVEWSPFKETEWLMPLLTDLNGWRNKMHELESEVEEKKLDVDLTFVADFPGLVLENYIAKGLNTTIEVFNGEINVELVEKKKNFTLKVGDKITVPSGTYHNVYTISKVPSCFLYIYRNETSTLYTRLFENYKKNMDTIYNKTLELLIEMNPDIPHNNITYDAYTLSVMDHSDQDFISNLTNSTFSLTDADKLIQELNVNVTNFKTYFIKAFHDYLYERHVKKKLPFFTKFYRKLNNHIFRFKRSFWMAYFGFKSIITREDFITLLNRDFYQLDTDTEANISILFLTC